MRSPYITLFDTTIREAKEKLLLARKEKGNHYTVIARRATMKEIDEAIAFLTGEKI